MEQQILAIVDEEREFSRRLCKYVKEKRYPFQAVYFTEVENLMRYEALDRITVVLISKRLCQESGLDLVYKGKILIMSDVEEEGEIYKYQPAENLIKTVMSCFSSDVRVLKEKPERVKYIGMFTPVHRSLQTSFAVTMGQLLAKKRRTLYINLESFSGFSVKLHKTYNIDMSDILYMLNNKSGGLYFKIQTVMEKIGNMDYLPPMFSLMDLHQVEESDWFNLFEYIEENMDYEYVILDLGECMRGLLNILNYCDHVFTLVKDDYVAMAKIKQYEDVLHRMNYEDLEKRTKKLKVPVFKNVPINFEELPHCELSEYVEEIISEEFDG